MKIRGAAKKDFDGIAELIKEEYFKHYKARWTKEHALETLGYYSGVGKIFVGETGGQVVGAVIVREEYYNDGKSVMVEEIVVKGDFQGKGVGRRLMEFVEGYCKKEGIGFIWLITDRKVGAFEFYKKIGYKHEEDTVYFSRKLK